MAASSSPTGVMRMPKARCSSSMPRWCCSRATSLLLHSTTDEPDAPAVCSTPAAVLGKWLAREPRLLIIDEPTRGIDVGTKAEVHRILDGLVATGWRC